MMGSRELHNSVKTNPKNKYSQMHYRDSQRGRATTKSITQRFTEKSKRECLENSLAFLCALCEFSVLSVSRFLVVAKLRYVIFSFLFLVGCTQTSIGPQQPVTITIAGSTALRPALQMLTTEFNRQHEHVLFELRGGGSTLGEEWIATGQIDLAASALFPTVAAEDSAALRGRSNAAAELIRIPIGLDGLAVVVHANNKIEGLTLLELRDLFSGSILDWADAGDESGGYSGEVLLISREDGSGARKLFEERVMADERVSLTAVVMPTSADVIDYVEKNPQSVGYVSRGYVSAQLAQNSRAGEAAALTATDEEADDDSALELKPVRVVTVEGELPLIPNLRSQSYYLMHPLYLISQGEPEGWTARFVDFVLSPSGQEIVAHFHAPVR